MRVGTGVVGGCVHGGGHGVGMDVRCNAGFRWELSIYTVLYSTLLYSIQCKPTSTI